MSTNAPKDLAHLRRTQITLRPLANPLSLGFLALDNHESFGVWGGTGERTRRRARARGMSAAEVLAERNR
jgi:hypothetical protein